MLIARVVPNTEHRLPLQEAERAQRTAILRQLDQIERQVSATPQAATTPQRDHFDSARLMSDVRRIRAGIDAYLTPERAQPRNLQDVSPISGNDTRQFEMGVRP